MSLPLTLAATALAVLTALTVPALAEGTSQDDVLRGDLLAGWQVKPGAHNAGLRLQLAEGWKTGRKPAAARKGSLLHDQGELGGSPGRERRMPESRQLTDEVGQK